MKQIVFSLAASLLFFFTPLYTNAQGDIPRLQLEKTSFGINEPISFRYEGEAAPLSITLSTSQGNPLFFKAPLHIRNNVAYVDIEPVIAPVPGEYKLRVSKDEYVLIDSVIKWGGAEENTIPHTSILRKAETEVAQDTTTNVSLTFTPSTTMENGELIDYVPYDAVITSPQLKVSKDPSLLHIGKPFDGDYEVSLPFGQVDPSEHFDIPYHDGTDFALPYGTPIKAADYAEVIPYREINQYGITIALQHAWGQTYYGHLSTASAQIGQKVKKGDIIGYSGNTGLSSGPHLHFGLKWQESFIDPYPHISNSPYEVSQKEIHIPFTAVKDKPYSFTYSYLIPSTNYSSTTIYVFGPAHTTTHDAQEESKSYVKMLENTPNSLTLDNIRLTYAANTQELRGIDLVTNTSFTQKLDLNTNNYLHLDDKAYLINVDHDKLISLTPS